MLEFNLKYVIRELACKFFAFFNGINAGKAGEAADLGHAGHALIFLVPHIQQI